MRKLAVTAAGGSLVLASTGCGLIPGLGQDPFDVISNAVQDMRAVDTYRAEVVTEGGVADVGGQDSVDLEYVAEPEPTMRMSMEVPGQGQGEVLARGTEMLIEGDPQLGTAEWLRMDLSEYGELVADPVAGVEQLLASDEVEEVGEEDIEGTATTHYTGTYPVSESLDEIEDSEAREMAAETYEEMDVDEVEFDVWITDDDMPRRVQDQVGEMSSTVDFLEFNADITIDYPDEGQIEDFDMDLGEMPDVPDAPDAPGEIPDMPEAPDAEDLGLDDMEESLDELDDALEGMEN